MLLFTRCCTISGNEMLTEREQDALSSGHFAKQLICKRFETVGSSQTPTSSSLSLPTSNQCLDLLHVICRLYSIFCCVGALLPTSFGGWDLEIGPRLLPYTVDVSLPPEASSFLSAWREGDVNGC